MATYAQMQEQSTGIVLREIRPLRSDMLRQYKIALDKTRDDLAIVYARILSDVDPKDYYVTMQKFNRLQKLEKSIIKTYNEHAIKAGKDVERASRLAISNNYYRNQYSTTWFDPYPFTMIDPVAIEVSVYGTADVINRVKNTTRKARLTAQIPPSGKTLKKLLSDNKTKEVEKVLQTVTQGLIRGDSFKRMSGEVKDVFDESASNALRVMRTEGHRNLEAGQWNQWNDAKDLGVEGGRNILSAGDNKMRPQSAAMDGQSEDENGMFTYPGGIKAPYPGSSGVARFDINDRETTIVSIDGQEPELRRARNPVTGKNEVVSFKDFDKWTKENDLKKNKYGELVTNKKYVKKVKR
jgi:hypothetical protein